MSLASASRDWRGIRIPAPGRWQIEAGRSEVDFVARYLRVARVRGRFHRLRGSITVAEQPEDSTLDVAIEASSVATGIGVLDRLLCSERILAAEEFPELRFRTTSVDVAGDTRLQISGDLTVRDITRQVEIGVWYAGIDEGGRARFRAAGAVDRTDYGITWRRSPVLAARLVPRHIGIELDVVATPIST